MKNALLLMATLLMFAYNAKAQDKNPYVDYQTAPTNLTAEQKIINLKSAMQGKAVAGATVNSDAADYKSAWGDQLYDEVLKADNSKLTIGKSVGGEVNWGITTNGIAGTTGKVLPAGLETIWFGNVEIAKVGTNYCFNAITPFKMKSGDPDEVAFVPPTGSPVNNTGTPGNTNNFYVGQGNNQGGPSDRGISYLDGMKIFDDGASFYAMVQDKTVKLLKENPLGCCGGESSSGSAKYASAPILYAQVMPVGGQVSGQGQGSQKTGLHDTFIGGVMENTIGHVAGTYIVRFIDRLTGRSGYRRYNRNNQLINTYYDFQDGNQLGNGGGQYNNDWPNIVGGLVTGSNTASYINYTSNTLHPIGMR